MGLTPLVCANLPYNAATPILHALVESGRFEALTVMVQREVAQRLAAKPGTGAYGERSMIHPPKSLFHISPRTS